LLRSDGLCGEEWRTIGGEGRTGGVEGGVDEVETAPEKQ
jgi:hypothetical protein